MVARSKRARQRKPPRKPHSPTSQRMGARFFFYYNSYHKDTQINANGNAWVAGVPWPKYLANLGR